jgi:hypothetical protein
VDLVGPSVFLDLGFFLSVFFFDSFGSGETWAGVDGV